MKIYLIDTFTNEPFGGSPAAVVILDQWYSDDLLIKLSQENAVPESAFLVRGASGYEIRWFTHHKEIRLCGHVTLAAAYVVSHFLEPGCSDLRFSSIAGTIPVLRKPGDIYELCLNAFDLLKIPFSDMLLSVLGQVPDEAYLGRDYLLVYENEDAVRSIRPKWDETLNFQGKLISITAKGKEFDCVSRTFVPHNRMAEEAACGSAHCHAVPYWAERLGKREVSAYQASQRGGTLYCKYADDKVFIAGGCVLYAAGEIRIPLC